MAFYEPAFRNAKKFFQVIQEAHVCYQPRQYVSNIYSLLIFSYPRPILTLSYLKYPRTPALIPSYPRTPAQILAYPGTITLVPGTNILIPGTNTHVPSSLVPSYPLSLPSYPRTFLPSYPTLLPYPPTPDRISTLIRLYFCTFVPRQAQLCITKTGEVRMDTSDLLRIFEPLEGSNPSNLTRTPGSVIGFAIRVLEGISLEPSSLREHVLRLCESSLYVFIYIYIYIYIYIWFFSKLIFL